MAKRTKKTAARLTAETRVAVLHGKDAFLRSEYTNQLKEALQAVHGEIDVIRYDGKDASPADILDECRSFGLMTTYKLIVVENADALLKESDTPAGHFSSRQLFERYAESPSDSASLVLRADTWHKGKLDKAVEKVGAVNKCEPPDEATAAAWARKRCAARHDAEITPQAAAMLVGSVGPDLGRLDAELAKLATVNPGEPISIELVRDMVGLSREEEFWSIQQALLSGSPAEGLAQLRELIEVSRHDPVPLMWAYIDLARKLHGASQGIANRQPPQAIASALRLWGPGRDSILRVAQNLSPRAAADLLHESVQADRRAKTGRTNPVRALEVLTLRFASAAAR